LGKGFVVVVIVVVDDSINMSIQIAGPYKIDICKQIEELMRPAMKNARVQSAAS
jgi:hypothetical protein